MPIQKNIKVKHILFLVSCFFTNLLVAQDSTQFLKEYSLGEVIISTNKLQSKLKDVATKIELIDSARITNSNGTRLPDVLKTIGATTIKAYGTSPQLQSISMNGLGAQHSLILLDGIKLNSYQNSQLDLSIIPLHNIERIEVINNGVSSIYGSDAIGGMINIISKNRSILDGNKNYQANLSLSMGSFKTRNLVLGIDAQTNRFNINLFFEKESSDGNFEYYYDFGDRKEKLTRENSSYILFDTGLNFQYLINNNNSLRLISTYSDQDKNLPGIATGSASAKTKQIDQNWNNILISENTFSPTMFLHTTFNFQNNLMKYIAGEFQSSTYKNLVYSVLSELSLKKENYSITSGYNFTNASIESRNITEGTKRNQHAIFISSVFNPIQNFRIFPSARYDYFSDIDKDALTYKLGINYKPFSKINFSLRGNYGENFRAPSFNDLYWSPGGNINLQSEKSTNSEIGFSYFFNSFVNGNIDVGYTHIDAKDKIVWLPGAFAIWSPENIESSISENISLNLNLNKYYKKNISLNFDFGINLIDSRKKSKSYNNDPSYNKQAPYIPLMSSNIGFSFKYHFVGLNVFYQHTGKRYSDSGNNNSLKSINNIDCNLIVDSKLWDTKTQMKIEINNLFNNQYEIILGYPMPLRNYKITLTIQY